MFGSEPGECRWQDYVIALIQLELHLFKIAHPSRRLRPSYAGVALCACGAVQEEHDAALTAVQVPAVRLQQGPCSRHPWPSGGGFPALLEAGDGRIT